MLKLGTIVTVVLLLTLMPSHGLRLQPKDVRRILEVLKVKDDLEMEQLDVEGNQPKDDSEENKSMDGLLKKMEVIDLIEKADRDASKTKFGEIKLARDDLLKDEYGDYDMVAVNQGNDMIEEPRKRPIDFQKKKYHVLTPNNLLGISQADDGHRDPKDPLNEYFKVYVVLDPVAIEKSQKNDVLSKMISRIYALSPSLTEMASQNRERNRNSRFKVKSNPISRRYGRYSREDYDDTDYKPSKSKHNDDSGSGNGGRTGIPYMRPRGDIYEKN